MAGIISSGVMFLVASALVPSGTQSGVRPEMSRCSAGAAERRTEGASEVCLAAQEIQLAQSVELGSPEWREHLQEGVRHFQSAVARADGSIQLQALNGLVRLYGPLFLNDPASLEAVLQRLIALGPDDVGLWYQLSAAQEAGGNIESAESTLLSVRHTRADDVEPNRRLAQFYAPGCGASAG